eukprot:PhM_4_TR5530/c0_g1_i2/m.106462
MSFHTTTPTQTSLFPHSSSSSLLLLLREEIEQTQSLIDQGAQDVDALRQYTDRLDGVLAKHRRGIQVLYRARELLLQGHDVDYRDIEGLLSRACNLLGE